MADDRSRSPESSSRSGAGLALVVAVLLVLLPVLYVLSIGPADYLVRSDYLDAETSRAFYGPLVWLYNSYEPIQPLLEWYLEWWE